MKKNSHKIMIKGSILLLCLIILLTLPVITTAKQQSFSKNYKSSDSPPAYMILMFGRIFNPHIENNKICFRAINVICIIDEFYVEDGFKIYYLGWFRDVKVPIHFGACLNAKRIFIITGSSELPEF